MSNKITIDTNRKDLYKYNEPIERTKQRLTQLNQIGLEEVQYGEFGISGIVSGLYIEKVWSYSDKDWNDYIDWMQCVIDMKKVLNNI